MAQTEGSMKRLVAKEETSFSTTVLTPTPSSFSSPPFPPGTHSRRHPQRPMAILLQHWLLRRHLHAGRP